MRFTSYAGLLRVARRHADLSQRQLASRSGVAASVISSIESGCHFPRVTTLERLLHAAGLRLQAVAADGHVVDLSMTWSDQDAARDASYRRFPAHLDVRTPTPKRPWWYYFRDTAGVKSPLLTFDLNRSRRDGYRREDRRSARDPDARTAHPFAQSFVHIPGYRPRSRYARRVQDFDGW
jgi:transcriptional regulator with XRE-family HTH domain